MEYNNSTVYDCFNIPLTDDFGSPALNLPTVNIYDIPRPQKRDRCAPNLLPATISMLDGPAQPLI